MKDNFYNTRDLACRLANLGHVLDL